jgi:hypothetical protein
LAPVVAAPGAACHTSQPIAAAKEPQFSKTFPVVWVMRQAFQKRRRESIDSLPELLEAAGIVGRLKLEDPTAPALAYARLASG